MLSSVGFSSAVMRIWGDGAEQGEAELRIRKALLICAMALVMSLGLAAPALGVTISVDNPDAAYLARTSKIDFSGIANYTSVTDVTDNNVTVTVSPALTRRTVGLGAGDINWAWGTAGEVEETTAAALLSSDSSPFRSVSMQLNKSVYEFGFEGAPDQIGTPLQLTATFVVSNGGQILDNVTRTITVDGSGPTLNARLFAIRSDVPFDKVDVVIEDASSYGFYVAQLRYSETPPPLVDVAGTVKDAATGVGIPFAHLYVEWAGNTIADLTADYAGRYSVDLLPGDYTFYANAGGFPGTSEAVTVPETTPFTKDFTLSGRQAQPVYRFFNMQAGVHFYTANDAEFINTYRNLAGVFHYDGVAYIVGVGQHEGEVPLYRFFNKKVGVHFYTASESEKAKVIAESSDIYTYEGIAYFVRNDGKGLPVIRFYVPSRNTHFYTTDTSEITAGSKLSKYYFYEGPAFWVGGGLD